jgi:hypothetical protein
MFRNCSPGLRPSFSACLWYTTIPGFGSIIVLVSRLSHSHHNDHRQVQRKDRKYKKKGRMVICVSRAGYFGTDIIVAQRQSFFFLVFVLFIYFKVNRADSEEARKLRVTYCMLK